MTDIAVYQQPRADVEIAGRQIDDWIGVLTPVVDLASQIANSPFVPEGLRGSVPAVAAAILTARELGVPPMTGLANIHLIKGKTGLSALLMRALIQSKGHEWQDVDVSDVRVVVRGRRKGETEWTEASFTAAQAAKAGIQLGGYPQDKLYARASVRLARRKFADVIAGMPYSAEELEDGFDDEAEHVAPEPPAAAEPIKPQTAQRRTRRAPAADAPSPAPAANGQPAAPTPPAAPQPDGPPLPGEEDPDIDKDAPGSVIDSKGMVGKIQTIYSSQMDFKKSERDQMIAATEQIIGRELTGPLEGKTHNNLSWNEARKLIDTLERCGTREKLAALLEETAQGGGNDGDDG